MAFDTSLLVCFHRDKIFIENRINHSFQVPLGTIRSLFESGFIAVAMSALQIFNNFAIQEFDNSGGALCYVGVMG
ncbi:MAG: hypothetical protein DRN21_06110, partial [Thermoplasmata archaeon]